MHLVKDNPLAAKPGEETFRVFHRTPHSRQFAVEILNPIEAQGQKGLAHSPHAAQPNDGTACPLLFQKIDPKLSFYHTR